MARILRITIFCEASKMFVLIFFHNLEAAKKITGKHCACNFIKKKTLAQMFSCEFCKISKNTYLFLQNTSEQLLLLTYTFFFISNAFFQVSLSAG